MSFYIGFRLSRAKVGSIFNDIGAPSLLHIHTVMVYFLWSLGAHDYTVPLMGSVWTYGRVLNMVIL